MIVPNKMVKQNSQLKQKSRYKTINSEERSHILHLFTDQGQTASEVAQQTGHKLSTVKAIFRVYKREGRIQKKSKRDKFIYLTQNHAICLVDDLQYNELQFVASSRLQETNTLRCDQDFTVEIEEPISTLLKNNEHHIFKELQNSQAQQQFLLEVQKISAEDTLPQFQLVEPKGTPHNLKDVKRLATEIKIVFDNNEQGPTTVDILRNSNILTELQQKQRQLQVQYEQIYSYCTKCG